MAILEGELPTRKVVSTFLGKDPESEIYVKQRVTENSRKAKSAETIFSPILSKNGYTLCSVATLTGRKHQIRIHAQWIDHCLVGEKLYGRDEQIYLKFCESGWQKEWANILGMSRQALHGRHLKDMETGVCFSAPLPEDFLHFLKVEMKLSDQEIKECVSLSDQLNFKDSG